VADKLPHSAPRAPETPLGRTLRELQIRAPNDNEASALRRMVRENPLAVTYLLGEVCGVGRVAFAGEQTHATAFKAGSQAVGIVLAMITGVPVAHLPREQIDREREDGDGDH
jgi:hypothetical protein